MLTGLWDRWKPRRLALNLIPMRQPERSPQPEEASEAEGEGHVLRRAVVRQLWSWSCRRLSQTRPVRTGRRQLLRLSASLPSSDTL